MVGPAAVTSLYKAQWTSAISPTSPSAVAATSRRHPEQQDNRRRCAAYLYPPTIRGYTRRPNRVVYCETAG